MLKALGDLAGAKACLERALKIDETVYGPGHPNVARDITNLSLVLKILGELDGAKACYKQSLTTLEKVLPEDHPPILRTL
ncbi:tetratricopeptide repeat protein [Heliobacterium chlorum]|uniref:tetratricopeptide repeat protein n=1 Tax=Heliobacterium chlorum TaxID=2698 RepID=UPI003C6C45EC